MDVRWLADNLILLTNFLCLYINFLLLYVVIFHFRGNICKMFAEGEFLRRKINSNSEETSITSLPREIHGAPPESIVVKLAEIIGNFKSLRKMALFWCRVVFEVCFNSKKILFSILYKQFVTNTKFQF